MMKEISKNDLHEVVLVGKGPELQTLFSIIGYNEINCGMFGLNWESISLYDAFYSEDFSVLRYNRNIPKRSVNIDDFLKNEYGKDIKDLTNIDYQLAKTEALFILKICFQFVKEGVLK